MKKTILGLVFISQVLLLRAQCVNGTSTNPSNPINNQIFGVRPELVNTFNWKISEYYSFPEHPDSYQEGFRIGKK